jgi:secreted PhoX family phosphatase
MIARVGPPNATNSFGPDPGRVWKLTDLSQDVVKGEVLADGDFGRLIRPDNLRFTDAGDLFIMEDHGSSEFAQARGSNDVWVLPRGESGAENPVLFATLPQRGEPTGPWFSNDGRLLYLSVQRDGIPSHVIAIRHSGNFNQPYDR